MTAVGAPSATGGGGPAKAFAAERAQLLARPGLTGPGRRRALSDLSDGFLAGLLCGALEREDDPRRSGVALVAVGGYGRRELSPGSDLDVLLLHAPSRDTAAASSLSRVAEAVWYPVWDSGVRLDHSVRTPAETRRVAGRDPRAVLGLLDARHLAGDAELTARMLSTLRADWRGFAHRRLPALFEDCTGRWAERGELAFLLEPDLKDSRGGLRDVVVARAVVASWLVDVPHAPLDAARERLLDVRDSLHAVTARATDRLVMQEHAAVAERLGLADEDDLLRAVSAAGRTVSYTLDVAWRRVLAAAAARRRRPSRVLPLRTRPRRPLAEGVVEQDGEVVLARDARPERDPLLALRAAAAAALWALPIAPATVDRLAREAAPVPEPWPDEARHAFVSLLGAGRATLPVWEALDQAGIVSRLLPGWERLRGAPQRNAVHRFCVDRHLIETAVEASALTRRAERPDLLLLGALLHDVGKGLPGDHSENGAVIARDLVPRMGLDAADAAVVETLVRHHLLLPETATRRDLDDPATVAKVVETVGSADVLDLLHALTEADARATGPVAWNEWRAGLIGDLVGRTHALLLGVGRRAAPPPGVSIDEQQLVDEEGLALRLEKGAGTWLLTLVAPDGRGLLATVAGVLALHRLAVRSAVTRSGAGPRGRSAASVWTVVPEFGEPPPVTILREDLRQALGGRLDLPARLRRLEDSGPRRPAVSAAPPRVDVVPDASSTSTVLEVRARDRPGLLHRMAAALTGAGTDIVSARVGTLGADVVDVFYVTAPSGGGLTSAAAGAAADALRRALADEP